MQQFLTAIAFIFIFSSCKDKSENNLIVYRVADEGLQQSIKNISLSTDRTYYFFEDKLRDRLTKEMAESWQPRAMEIKRLSDDMVTYIRELKNELKSEAGGNDPKNKDWENSLTISEHLFKSHSKGKELLEKLIKYQEAVLAVDLKMKREFEQTINIFSNGFNFTIADATEFGETFFSNIPVLAANVMLSKLENNIKICENEMVTYCYNQIGYLDGPSMFTKYQPLVVQSSSYVKAGEKIEIFAGIGEISTASQPQVIINGKIIQPNENGVVSYKFLAPEKTGDYNVLVKIEFTKPDGEKDFLTKVVKYTVVE